MAPRYSPLFAFFCLLLLAHVSPLSCICAPQPGLAAPEFHDPWTLNAMPAEASSNGKRGFVLANTRLIAPPLTPEIRLRLADEAVPIWKKTEDELGAMGLPPPFWAFAWAGGQRSEEHT